jgi:hypothetical protein
MLPTPRAKAKTGASGSSVPFWEAWAPSGGTFVATLRFGWDCEQRGGYRKEEPPVCLRWGHVGRFPEWCASRGHVEFHSGLLPEARSR